MRSLAVITFFLAGQLYGQPWGALLNSSLDKWEVWTGSPHESVADIPSGVVSSADGKSGEPVGLGDPFNVFTVMTVDEQPPVLHITGQVFGALTSKAVYENYHFTTQIKWGPRKWAPNDKKPRNSGVLYHCHGPHGVFWNAFMASLQVQYKEGAEGGLIQLGGPYSMVKVDADGAWNPEGKLTRKDRSVPGQLPAGLVLDGWNQIDLYVYEGRAIHALNGVKVLEVESSYTSDGKPLRSGKIQIQSEGAEVFFRDMHIQPLEALPTQF